MLGITTNSKESVVVFSSVLFINFPLCMCHCRENELLKHQLKKYVGAVQLLRRQESQEGAGGQALSRTTPEYRDYHHEATAYEKKLIQVRVRRGQT